MGGLTGALTVSAVWLLGAFTPPSLFSMASIVADDDEDVFLQFKEESKKQYSRIWSQFRDFVPEHDFQLAYICIYGGGGGGEGNHLISCGFLTFCVIQVSSPRRGGGRGGILLEICNMYV